MAEVHMTKRRETTRCPILKLLIIYFVNTDTAVALIISSSNRASSSSSSISGVARFTMIVQSDMTVRHVWAKRAYNLALLFAIHETQILGDVTDVQLLFGWSVQYWRYRIRNVDIWHLTGVVLTALYDWPRARRDVTCELQHDNASSSAAELRDRLEV